MRIEVTHEGKLVNEYLIDKQDVTIGRSPDNDICIDNPMISGLHATLHCNEHSIIIADMNSTNGVKVNGQKVEKQQLSTKDQIWLGPFSLVFYPEEEHPVTASGEQQAISSIDPDATVHMPTDFQEQLSQQLEQRRARHSSWWQRLKSWFLPAH